MTGEDVCTLLLLKAYKADKINTRGYTQYTLHEEARMCVCYVTIS